MKEMLSELGARVHQLCASRFGQRATKGPRREFIDSKHRL
jgi:hypothetical protein